VEKILFYFRVLYDSGKSDKEQKNHKNSLRIDDGPHRLEIGNPRTCLCRTTGKEFSMESSVYCGSEDTLHLITSGDSLEFKISELCCEQKAVD
jgi:hypothetical protein